MRSPIEINLEKWLANENSAINAVIVPQFILHSSSASAPSTEPASEASNLRANMVHLFKWDNLVRFHTELNKNANYCCWINNSIQVN